MKVSEQLRKSILQAAIQGKLTEQHESDGSAYDLLQEIRSEKEQLIKDKRIKKEKPLAPITEEEIPFDIPENWEWVRLDDVSYGISPKKHQIKSSEVIKKGNYPVVSQSATFIDGYSNEVGKLLELKSPIIVFGDHSKTVKFVNFNFIVGADGTKLIQPMIEEKFMYYVILYLLIGMETKNYGRHFSLLRKDCFPLPPLTEQKRIVERLDSLMFEIDMLDTEI